MRRPVRVGWSLRGGNGWDRDVTSTDPEQPARGAGWRGIVRSPAILAWAVHIALVAVVAAATAAVSGERIADGPYGSGPGRTLVNTLSVWDGAWYVRIARNGYGRDEASAAFWPLYPLLLDLGQGASGLPFETVGVVLSSGFFLIALRTLYRLIRLDYGDRLATRGVWLAALSPLSFFFATVYTEAVFLLLTVGAVLLGRTGRWTGAGLLAAGAALTRNSGLLVLLPLVLELARQRGADPRRWWRQGVQLAAAGTAPVVFAVHLDRVWGDPLLALRAQEFWGRTRTWPWQTVSDAVHRMHRTYATGRHGCEVHPSLDAVDRCRLALGWNGEGIADDLSFLAMIGFVLVLPMASRLLPRDGLYLAAGLALPLFAPAEADPLHSVARYAIVLYPIYVVVALVFRPTWAFVGWLVMSALAGAGLLALFAQRYFVA